MDKSLQTFHHSVIQIAENGGVQNNGVEAHPELGIFRQFRFNVFPKCMKSFLAHSDKSSKVETFVGRQSSLEERIKRMDAV